MKKIIKIFTLILLMLFVFGITTSRAEEFVETEFAYGSKNTTLSNRTWYKETSSNLKSVSNGTSAADMIEALTNGQRLWKINNENRDENPNLLCRESNWYLSNNAQYELAGDPITYDTTTPYDLENEYAKAYILAQINDENEKYIKSDGDYSIVTEDDEIQYAWYYVSGETNKNNDLAIIALGYQEYKKSEEKDTEIIVDPNIKPTIFDDKIVYGPINVSYSYKKTTGEKDKNKFDEWGGFYYAFFNAKDENISEKVQLCILNENDEYESINSQRIQSEDETNGYYKVRTAIYNNIDLFIKITDKTESSVKLKIIQEKKIDYQAKVYPIRGEYKKDNAETHYCANCKGLIEKALANPIEDYSEVIAKGEGTIFAVKDKTTVYVYTGTYTDSGYCKTNGGISNSYEWNKDETTRKNAGTTGSYPKYSATFKCDLPDCSYHGKGKHSKRYDSELKAYICTSCHKQYCSEYPIYHTAGICKHDPDEQHLQSYYKYTKLIYKFEDYPGCDLDIAGDKISECGTFLEAGFYHSQGLYIIESTSTNISNGVTLDLDIPLSTTIEITKKWEDFNNEYQTRPNDINIVVSRSTDKENWTTLTKDTDYKITVWTKNEDVWTAIVTELKSADDDGNYYYFKVEEVALNYYDVTYSKTLISTADKDTNITITNKIKETKIDITKNWNDNNDELKLRPNEIKFNVFRSTDNQNWEKLTEDTHYKLTWGTTEGNNTWRATISELLKVDSQGQDYFFKVEEQELVYYQASYPNGKIPSYNEDTLNMYIVIDNTYKKIDINGYVWLDGQTGIKPAEPNNGILDEGEIGLENIRVYLCSEEGSIIGETKTDKNGSYKFEEYQVGHYYVKFEYDGINYEDTISVQNGNSKAFEAEGDRNTFNSRFQTITYRKSNNGRTLNYDYDNNKSALITTEGNGKVKEEFVMNATSKPQFYSSDVNDINLGLVKRGTDIALSTDVANAEVNINGQKTNYTFNNSSNTIEIGNGQKSENVSYNLNLYTSDYYYRIRKYVSNDTFKQKNYINEENPEEVKTGEELKVYVTYELNLQNQSTETVRINEVKYTFDEKYTFIGFTDNSYNDKAPNSGNVLTINLNGLSLGEGETKTLYLIFEVKLSSLFTAEITSKDFSNKAEITSYSTDDGLIDTDSQPGNFMKEDDDNNDGEIDVEDDNDTAGGLTIKLAEDTVRKITGKVFDSDNNQNINDVIVQLIELKTVTVNEDVYVYEYIWQETVSGTGKGLRLNAAGTALEEYTYTKTDGAYEFIGFIPGDYIVRFIYGDGTTYDMTGNVIKYNGQDYKSTEDSNYKSEWYNSATYAEGTSVARDNEARRLETMAYSVNIDASKGVLLKLLNNVTVADLNETEKEVLVSTYNNLYDPDITEVTSEDINKLLKEQVLKNTWMCAETSKIKVAVDTESINNTSTTTTVNGINTTYVEEIPNIDLGLELRPATKIELKKYITGFKLTAANGQTLVNAYIDVDKYLDNPTDISNDVEGIKDNVTILNTVWQYEVAPTDINTIVDGASLEFEYTLVVKNTGETDYLGAELADAYKNKSTTDYITILTGNGDDIPGKVNEIKGYMRAGTYSNNIGKAVGNSYYVGGTGASKVLTEVTNIRDYVNNDLTFAFAYEGKVEIDDDENLSHTYRTLRDDHGMQNTTINTILRTTEATGKMENGGTTVMYKVTLGKNPISATGNLNFENYIAEVMSYTNAAGRRVMYYEDGELKTATPGNAEIIDHEYREGKSHEIDEADTGRIQIGAATGEDVITNYIIIISVIAGVLVIAAGAFVVKKYVIK